ncbi:hypothetical protein XENOCAPTIV_019869, partial [Xenoophorus captivus]
TEAEPRIAPLSPGDGLSAAAGMIPQTLEGGCVYPQKVRSGHMEVHGLITICLFGVVDMEPCGNFCAPELILKVNKRV